MALHIGLTRTYPSSMLLVVALAVFLVPGQAKAEMRFQDPQVMFHTDSRAEAVAVGDLNSDGRPDFLMTTSWEQSPYYATPDDFKVFVFMQQPDGTFQRQALSPGDGTIAATIADINGDGHNEIITGGPPIRVWKYMSDGTFSYSEIPGSFCCVMSLRAADLNGDGRPELLVGTDRGAWVVYYHPGDGAYDSVQLNNADTFYEMETADVNGDGLRDVVFHKHGSLGWFEQQPDGAFGPEHSFPVSFGGRIEGVAVADVTGDGREDLLFPYNDNRPRSKLLVFPQLTGGGFSSTPIQYDSYDLPAPVDTFDINGDGRKDVIVGHYAWNAIGIYEALPGGGLAPEQLVSVPQSYYWNSQPFGFADLDADGRIDVVGSDSYGLYVIRRLPPPASPYVRPKGASPIQVPLVPAYAECTSPNRTHGAPLAYGSCSPATLTTGTVTLGTPDANGKPAKGHGSVRISAVAGDPSTPENEADVRFDISVTDVRNKDDLTDYQGELAETNTIRITDGNSDLSGVSDSGTAEDMYFAPVIVPCSPTADPDIGSTCSTSTSVNAIIPGAVVEGQRSVWQFSGIEVFDGGPDGLAVSDDDNTLFLRQGLYVP